MNTEKTNETNLSDLFIQASRQKLRFFTNRGQLSVEDLWDLGLRSLDGLAVKLHEQMKPEKLKSFIEEPDKKKDEAHEKDKQRLELLKYVIEVKQREKQEAEDEKKSKMKKKYLEDLLKKKEMAVMDDLSIEAIQKRLGEFES